MGYRVASLLSLVIPLACCAQTFTTSGGDIPDDGTAIEFPIAVSGLDPATIDTAVFGLETVCLNVSHTWISDLEVTIIAPDGSSALLINGVGGDSDDFTFTCINADATDQISDGTPPYTGTYRPAGQMGLVNNGQNGNGIWKLRFYDTYAFADEGELLDASLTFGSEPASYYTITSSDLPIVVINTFGATIPNEPKVFASMGIIDNGPGNINNTQDPFNGYNDHVGIETRGNSSQMFQKKSYGFELWDANGLEIEAPLLGMPSESDWVLSANYSDKSLLNNALTFDLAQRTGRYAPRWRHVEVLLNGAYVGTYVLMEKIKRDAGRVDIAKLDPDELSGDDLTGGYIIKLDWAQGSNVAWWASAFEPPNADGDQTVVFLVDYPKDPAEEQSAYIKAYTDSFELALDGPDFADQVIGYRRFLNVNSAIDFLLVNEFAKNVDGYRLSTFLHKDKDSNGGKLTFGPVWDFDLAFANANYCDGSAVEGWSYLFADVCPGDGSLPPFWWRRFMEDPAFTDSLRCRWEGLRHTVFDPARLDNWCDSMATHLAIAQEHNFTLYPILGEWVWPNPEPVPTTYLGEIQEMKSWIHARWAWLDQHIPGLCLNTYVGDERRDAPSAYPNPFTDRLDVVLPQASSVLDCRLLNSLGEEVPIRWSLSARDRLQVIPLVTSAGVHVIRIRTANTTWSVVAIGTKP